MPTSVRLDAETESELERIARIKELSRSDVIREAIHAYGAEIVEVPPATLAESWSDVIGSVASETGDLTTGMRERLADRIRERHRQDRSSSPTRKR